MSDWGLALLICVTPFVTIAVMAALADGCRWVAARWWPAANELQDWREWYD